jgi:prepilin-type N-terminal cleavage/methylation domain-containing protein
MNKRRLQIASLVCGKAQNGERGFTLIEILVALGILAAVAVVFLLGMTTSSKAVMVSQERVAVDSLAKSQMEYVKSLPYDDVNNPITYPIDPNLDIPPGYSILVNAERLNPDGPSDPPTDDDGLQQITVTVTRNGELSFELVGYKVNR